MKRLVGLVALLFLINPLPGKAEEQPNPKTDYPAYQEKVLKPPFIYQKKNYSYKETEKTVKDFEEIPYDVLKNLIINHDYKKRLMDREANLNYGKVKREPLRGTNLFYFNSSIPVVIVLPKDKEVVNAFVYSAGGGSVIYRKNLIIVSPPKKGSGKFMTVIAVDKDGNEYTFIGESVNPLYESVPVYGKYVYYESQKMTPSEVLLFYKQLTGHCPNDGDTISISGQKYLFKVVDKIYTRDEVSACGKNYKVIPE